MSSEIGKYIPLEEWEYLEGVLDQGLGFGIWPNKEKEGQFIHRIDFFNTSKRLTYLLEEKFGGKVGIRDRRVKYPPGRKLHFQWSIANAQAGLEFLDQATDHLHFKGDLAEKYAGFLQALLDTDEDLNDHLEDFNKTKLSPPSEKVYLPTSRNLAGRLDANGFIGIQERYNAPLSRAYAQVCLGTEFPGLGLSLKEKYRGSFAPHRSSYLWTVNEKQAARVLEAALPDLRNMRDRAELALEFEALNPSLSNNKREEYFTKSRQLNANPL